MPAIDPIELVLITRLLLHDGDLDLGYIVSEGLTLTANEFLPSKSTPPLLETAHKVHHFARQAQNNALERF